MLVWVALLTAAAQVYAAPTPLYATWINVWINSNQPYVPGPGGLASHGIQCDWVTAMQRYDVSFPPGSGMSLANPHAVDWTGGAEAGNMFAYIALIARAGINAVILDYTNGFGAANSRFPPEPFHAMIAAHFPDVQIAYAVSPSGVEPALSSLQNTSANYLHGPSGRPVLVLYGGYESYVDTSTAHPELKILFANGESTDANKGGWHGEPFNGHAPHGGDEVFWLAPSLDWQAGTNSTSWTVSLPWFAYGMHALRRAEQQPWLAVLGSFDDVGERNLWLPAVTSNATPPATRTMRTLQGEADSGAARADSGDWTVFYDTVRAFVTKGTLPVGNVRAIAVAPSTGPAASLYVNPPYPFNQGLANGSATALFRSNTSFPADQLFPLSDGSVLRQFRFQSRDDKAVTSAAAPIAIGTSCDPCGHPVCRRTLPGRLPNVNYSAAENVSDCDMLDGTGVSFVTPGARSGDMVAVQSAFRTQTLVYVAPATKQSLKDHDNVILWALASGLVYFASDDFARVQLAALDEKSAASGRHVWSLEQQQGSNSFRIVTERDDTGETFAWAVSSDPLECSEITGEKDCVLPVRLVNASGPLQPGSVFSVVDPL